jgi:hypothetical protein
MHLNAFLFLSLFLIGPSPLSLFFFLFSFPLAAQPRPAFSSPFRTAQLARLTSSLSLCVAQPVAFFLLSFPSLSPRPAACPNPLSSARSASFPLPHSLTSEWVPPARAFSLPAPNSDSSPSPAGVRHRFAPRGASGPHA